MTDYRRRILDDLLDELADELPAIEIYGAKGVGKTATALRRARSAIRLDSDQERSLLAGDPERIRRLDHPLLVDEWQRFPASWDLVRRAVDDHVGSYLLTGSAVPTSAPTHTGAGRMVAFRMRPLSLAERGVETPTVSLARLFDTSADIDGSTEVGMPEYAEEITASGFPDIHDLSTRARTARLEGYVHAIVQRSFPEQGLVVKKPRTLRSWLTAYAAATSMTVTYSKILDAATPGEAEKPARSTVQAYRDVLDGLWILDPVPAWLPTRNHLNRLAKSPKHQLADPALAANLLGIDAGGLLSGADTRSADLREGTLLGALFENLVAQSVQVYAESADAHVGHLRTERGEHEVDLIVERRDGRIVAIEVKLSTAPTDHDLRHLHWLKQKLPDLVADLCVVTTGTYAYRRPDGIAVIPAALLGP
ncbi:DUF4143 domain-containing protein [Isoptericola hypogeus]|uniref:DUF4143 domain-containing protein n=1 Tax=Isoptericola hypogeus TaxID=300179 RepID=A0ABN2JKJ2_9MICO